MLRRPAILVSLHGIRWMPIRQLHAGLRDAGIPVESFYFRETFEQLTAPREAEIERFVRRIAEEQPSVVAFGVTAHSLEDARRLSVALRRLCAAPIVWGGPLPTIDPDSCLPHADYLLRGEADRTLSAFLRRLAAGAEPWDIPGLVAQGRGDFGRYGFCEDLEGIPTPDWSDEDKHYFVHGRWFRRDPTRLTQLEYYIRTARGCPYACTFCANHAYRRTAPERGAYFRRRSVEHVIDELRRARAQFPRLRKVCFWDDVFTLDEAWIERFCAEYRRHIGLPFFAYTHPLNAEPKMIDRLRHAGWSDAVIGVESFSHAIRRQWFGRRETDAQVADAIERLSDSGLRLRVDLIHSPLETPAEVHAGLQRLLRLRGRFRVVMHEMAFYRGYRLTRKCLNRGIVDASQVLPGPVDRRYLAAHPRDYRAHAELHYFHFGGRSRPLRWLARQAQTRGLETRAPRLLRRATLLLRLRDQLRDTLGRWIEQLRQRNFGYVVLQLRAAPVLLVRYGGGGSELGDEPLDGGPRSVPESPGS